jgi:putative transposase
VKYAFIKQNSGLFSLGLLCSVLRVSRSGFYHWQKQQPSRDKKLSLVASIKRIHSESRKSYGSPRIYRALQQEGVAVGRSTVERVMRAQGLRGKKRRRTVVTTDSNHGHPSAPNLVSRIFDRGAVHRVWLCDITYIRTVAGFAYLAAIIDGHSRKIVGFSVKDHMREELVHEALRSAYWRERPNKGLLLHSDRGSQYSAEGYRKLATSYGMIQSMSRKGNCWDNAPMESFFDTLKTEAIGNIIFTSAQEAMRVIFEWIEVFYNRKRLHSAIGYLTPSSFEEKYRAKAA